MKIKQITILTALLSIALLCPAQVPTMNTSHFHTGSSSPSSMATAPTYTFSSTSSYIQSGIIDEANHTLPAQQFANQLFIPDGIVGDPPGGGPSTGGYEDQPLSDALPFLLLLSVGYISLLYRRRHRPAR